MAEIGVGIVYTVVGVDQDGDAMWDIGPDLVWANARADELSDIAFERPKIFKVVLPEFTVLDT